MTQGKGKKNTKVKKLRYVYGKRDHALGGGENSKINGEEPSLEVYTHSR